MKKILLSFQFVFLIFGVNVLAKASEKKPEQTKNTPNTETLCENDILKNQTSNKLNTTSVTLKNDIMNYIDYDSKLVPEKFKNSLQNLIKKWNSDENKELKKAVKFYMQKIIKIISITENYSNKNKQKQTKNNLTILSPIITAIQDIYLTVFQNLQYRNEIDCEIKTIKNFLKNFKQPELEKTKENLEKAIKSIEIYYANVETLEWYLYKISNFYLIEHLNKLKPTEEEIKQFCYKLRCIFNSNQLNKLEKPKYNSTEFDYDEEQIQNEVVKKLTKLTKEYGKLHNLLNKKNIDKKFTKEELQNIIENGQIKPQYMENLNLLKKALELENLKYLLINDKTKYIADNKKILEYFEKNLKTYNNFVDITTYYEKIYKNTDKYKEQFYDNSLYETIVEWENFNQREKYNKFVDNIKKFQEYENNKNLKIDLDAILELQANFIEVMNVFTLKFYFDPQFMSARKIKNVVPQNFIKKYDDFNLQALKLLKNLNSFYNNKVKNALESDNIEVGNNNKYVFFNYFNYNEIMTIFSDLIEKFKAISQIETLQEAKNQRTIIFNMFEPIIRIELYKTKQDLKNPAIVNSEKLEFIKEYNQILENMQKTFTANMQNLNHRITLLENNKNLNAKQINNLIFKKNKKLYNEVTSFQDRFEETCSDFNVKAQKFIGYCQKESVEQFPTTKYFNHSEFEKRFSQTNEFETPKNILLEYEKYLNSLKSYDVEISDEVYEKFQEMLSHIISVVNEIITLEQIVQDFTEKFKKEIKNKIEKYEDLKETTKKTLAFALNFYNENLRKNVMERKYSGTKKLEYKNKEIIDLFTIDIDEKLKNVSNSTIFDKNTKQNILNAFKTIFEIEFSKLCKEKNEYYIKYRTKIMNACKNCKYLNDIVSKDLHLELENKNTNSKADTYYALKQFNEIYNKNYGFKKLEEKLDRTEQYIKNSNFENINDLCEILEDGFTYILNNLCIIDDVEKILEKLIDNIDEKDLEKNIDNYDEKDSEKIAKYEEFKEKTLNFLDYIISTYEEKLATTIEDCENNNKLNLNYSYINTLINFLNNFDNKFSKIIYGDFFEEDVKNKILYALKAMIKIELLKLKNNQDKNYEYGKRLACVILEFCKKHKEFEDLA